MLRFGKSILSASILVALGGCSTFDATFNPHQVKKNIPFLHEAEQPKVTESFDTTEVAPHSVQANSTFSQVVAETKAVKAQHLSMGYDHYGLEVIEGNEYFKPAPLYGRKVSSNYDLPRMRIVDNNLFNVMERLLQQTDYDLVMSNKLAKRKATRAFTLKGNLVEILSQLSRVFGVHIIEDKGTVYVVEKAEFFVQIPHVNTKLSNQLLNDIERLGGEGGKLGANGSIQYHADFVTNDRIDRYLSELRRNRPLISYNVYFWEVKLDRGASIRWDQYDRLVMKLDASLPIGIDDDGANSVEGVYNLQCSNNGIDPAFMQSFLKTQGEVRFTKRPELSAISGEPVEFSFSEGTNKGFGRVDKTSVKITGRYEANKVASRIEISNGVVRGVENEDKDVTKIVLNESARSYPGGVSLITDINAHAKERSENIQYVMMIEPKVDLFEHPGERFLQNAGEKAHHACELERKNRKKTLTFRALMEKEMKHREKERDTKVQRTEVEFNEHLLNERDQKEVKVQQLNQQ